MAQRRRREIVERVMPFVRQIVLVLATLAIVGICFAVVYNSPLFSVTDVTVEGTGYLTADQVTQLASLDGTTLLRLDKDQVRDNLAASAWVSSVDVSRVFPDTVRLVVTERTVAALVTLPVTTDQPQARTWAVSTDGVWLAQVDASDTSELGTKLDALASTVPTIAGVSGSISPAAGTAIADEGILNALGILNEASSSLTSQIVSFDAPSADQTSFTLASNVTIAFGSTIDLQSKERVVLQLLAEHQGAISYINVRVVERPAWRGLDAATWDTASTGTDGDTGTGASSDTGDDPADASDEQTMGTGDGDTDGADGTSEGDGTGDAGE